MCSGSPDLTHSAFMPSDRPRMRQGATAMASRMDPVLALITAMTTIVAGTEIATLDIGSHSVHDFGSEVSISGEYAIIGVRDEDRPSIDTNGNRLNGTAAGAAYIFAHSEGSWIEQAKLVPGQYQAGDRFGSSVKVSGDFAIVGADGSDDVGMSSGSAYIFSKTGENWTEQTRLVGADTAAGDRFGMSVALSGDTALVGAFWHTGPGGSGSGAAYVFVYDGQKWTQQAKLVANDSMAGDTFGLAVGLDGDTAIIGAPEVDGRGAAYVFERSGTTWSQQVKWVQDRNASGLEDDRFGSAVGISAGTAVVGAYWDDEQAINSGAIFVYTRNESGWFANRKILPPGGTNEQRFGISVDVSRNTLIVGSHFDNDQATYAGSAYIYVEISKDEWTFKDKLLWSKGRQSYFFGRHVAIWDTGYGPYTCAVGAPGANSTVMFEGDIPTTTTSTTSTWSATSSSTTSLSSTTSSTGTTTTVSSTATTSSSISSSVTSSTSSASASTTTVTTSSTISSSTSTWSVTSTTSSTSQSTSSSTTVSTSITSSSSTISTSVTSRSSTTSVTGTTTTVSSTSTTASSSSSSSTSTISQSSSSTTTTTASSTSSISSTLTTATKTTSTSSSRTDTSSTATSSTRTYTTETTTSRTQTTSTFTSHTVTNTTATQTSSTSSTATRSTSTGTTYTTTTTSASTTATFTSTTRSTITLQPWTNIDEQVSELFDEFQQGGTMTADDFKDLLDALGLDDASFSGADTNGDGKLELHEVQQAVKQGYVDQESMDLNGAYTRLSSSMVQLATLAAVLSHV
eukprot:TRINITY_DN74496_c0_g1_i1.p1 TRINITY_DN74496_c0_g1~~TRINITY_DN74496_c0_g1_i1.p1  ORF type:complete len:797 (-),score=118.99 TRINITY_DN74496_c0_g1_i1:84-2474(-)